MPTHEVPRPGWPGYFEAFADRHRGSLVTVQVHSPEIGAQVQAKDLPLKDLSLEGPRPESILLSLGDAIDTWLTHTIGAPEHVLVKTEPGGVEILEVLAADGSATLLATHPPGIPSRAIQLMPDGRIELHLHH